MCSWLFNKTNKKGTSLLGCRLPISWLLTHLHITTSGSHEPSLMVICNHDSYQKAIRNCHSPLPPTVSIDQLLLLNSVSSTINHSHRWSLTTRPPTMAHRSSLRSPVLSLKSHRFTGGPWFNSEAIAIPHLSLRKATWATKAGGPVSFDARWRLVILAGGNKSPTVVG